MHHVEPARSLRHCRIMEDTVDGFEEAARIVEAYAEGESDERVIELLAQIAADIRAKLIDE